MHVSGYICLIDRWLSQSPWVVAAFSSAQPYDQILDFLAPVTKEPNKAINPNPLMTTL